VSTGAQLHLTHTRTRTHCAHTRTHHAGEGRATVKRVARVKDGVAAAGGDAAAVAAAEMAFGASLCGHSYLFSVKHEGVDVLVSGNNKYEPSQNRVRYLVPLQHNEDAFEILGLAAQFRLSTPFESSPHHGKSIFMFGEKPFMFVRNLPAAGMVALWAEKTAACAAARAAEAAAGGGSSSGGGGGGGGSSGGGGGGGGGSHS